MLRKFIRRKRRAWLRDRIIANGEATRKLERERGILRASGMQDDLLDYQIEQRERRHQRLLTRFKEV